MDYIHRIELNQMAY